MTGEPQVAAEFSCPYCYHTVGVDDVAIRERRAICPECGRESTTRKSVRRCE